MNILSLDIDLGRIHGWSSYRGKVMYNAPEVDWQELLQHDLILAEIASPIFYMPRYNKGEVTNRMRWALFNGVTIGQIHQFLFERDSENRLLVAPSSDWTLGHPEEIRVKIAGVEGKDNHDIRECRCMQYYHKTNPRQWKSLPDYLASLKKGK